MFLPEVIRIRFPVVLFKASEHGYNIKNLYQICDQYNEGYEHVILLIETTESAIFGAYLDVIPAPVENKFVGSADSFVFTLSPQLNKFSAADNVQIHKVCLFEPNYFCVGFDGDGPAIRVDDQFKQGRSYKSATFNNEPLTQSTEIGKCNDFQIAKLEIIKL